MSKKRTERVLSGSKGSPKHPRDIADLAALVLSDLRTDDPEENAALMISVWRDCAMTIKFPSGRRMYVYPGNGQSLDSTVHELAVQTVAKYCQGAGIPVAEIRVHMVPPKAHSGEQIFAWFQSIPGISVSLSPAEGFGFGGPLPPAGEAG